jgi:hypothetical protein
MEWIWIRSQLRLAEWHLDAAAAAERAAAAHTQLEQARDAYQLASTALDDAELSASQQHELRETMHALSVRLYVIGRRFGK